MLLTINIFRDSEIDLYVLEGLNFHEWSIFPWYSEDVIWSILPSHTSNSTFMTYLARKGLPYIIPRKSDNYHYESGSDY